MIIEGGIELSSNLDELVNDMNRFRHAKITIYLHTGDKVETRSFTYHGLNIQKDNEGRLGLGDYEGGESYIVNHEDQIEKHQDSTAESTRYDISRNGTNIAQVYLY